MRKAIVLTNSAAVILAFAVTASAAPPQLKGQYSVTGSTKCIAAQGTGRFNSMQQVTNAPYYSHSNSVLAIRTYNGDGTGRVERRALPLSTPLPSGGPHTPAAGSSTLAFNFTYVADNNGTVVTQMVPGTFSGMVLTGPRAGQTYTESNFMLTGLVSGDKKIFELASIHPEVETTAYSNGDVREQICTRSRVHVFLGQ